VNRKKRERGAYGVGGRSEGASAGLELAVEELVEVGELVHALEHLRAHAPGPNDIRINREKRKRKRKEMLVRGTSSRLSWWNSMKGSMSLMEAGLLYFLPCLLVIDFMIFFTELLSTAVGFTHTHECPSG
jgi:hypothetical protein